jgi:hypothetical protein
MDFGLFFEATVSGFESCWQVLQGRLRLVRILWSKTDAGSMMVWCHIVEVLRFGCGSMMLCVCVDDGDLDEPVVICDESVMVWNWCSRSVVICNVLVMV